jgi:hypothetical protein
VTAATLVSNRAGASKDQGAAAPRDGVRLGRGGGLAARRGAPRRGGACAAALAVDALALGSALTGLGGGLRLALELAFFMLVPGWSLVLHLRLRWPAAEIALSLGASFALGALAGETMLLVHAWHPLVAEVLLGLAAAPSLASRLRREGARR